MRALAVLGLMAVLTVSSAARVSPAVHFPRATYIHVISCCARASEVPDFRVTGIEVTQGTQEYTLPSISGHAASYAGVKLVRHATTIIRVYADTASGSGSANALLYVSRGSTLLPNQPMSSLEGTKLLTGGPATATSAVRGDPKQGFTFKLPGDDAHGTLTLRAVIVPIGVLYSPSGGECSALFCFADNSVTLGNVTFVNTGTLRFHQVQLLNEDAGEHSLGVTPKDAYAGTRDMLPIGNDDMLTNHGDWDFSLDASFIASATRLGDLVPNCVHTVMDPTTCSQPVGKADQVDAATTLLRNSTQFANQEKKCVGDPTGQSKCTDVLVAMDDSFPNGLDSGSVASAGRPALDIVNTTDPRDIAHEIGHAIERMHTKGCTADNQDPAWPDAFGYLEGIGLDPASGSGSGYGAPYRPLGSQVDTGFGDPNASRSSTAFNPARWYDVMSYCTPGDVRGVMPAQAYWIAPLGWDEEVSALSAFASANNRKGRAVGVAATPVPGLSVGGFVSGGGALVLSTVTPGPGIVAAPDPSTPFEVVVKAHDGAVLARTPLAVEHTHVDGAHDQDGTSNAVALIDGHVALPAVQASGGAVPPAVASVQVLQNGIVVGEHRRSANPPTVALTSPAAAPGLAATAGPPTVAWRSADADGDRLMATVDVSSDGGRTWDIAFAGPDHGSAQIPASAFARTSSAKVRVRVSDGFDQAVAVSPAFSTAGVPPDVAIVAPSGNETVAQGTALSFTGQAQDDRGAELKGRALRWTIDGRAAGTGPTITPALRPGTHTVSLSAIDYAKRTASDRVFVKVIPQAPVLFAIHAPERVSPRARELTLRLSSTLPASLTVGGAGVRPTHPTVGRRGRAVRIAIAPGRAPLHLRLTVRRGRLGTRDELVERR